MHNPIDLDVDAANMRERARELSRYAASLPEHTGAPSRAVVEADDAAMLARQRADDSERWAQEAREARWRRV